MEDVVRWLKKLPKGLEFELLEASSSFESNSIAEIKGK
jgi:hypothetical protein